MQNYWYRCDWLTQAYPFKCVGAYESQILVDFTDNLRHSGFMSRSVLSLSVELCCYRSKTSRRSWWNVMKEQQGVSRTAILGHVGKWMYPHPPSGPPLWLAHTVSVWERDPPDVSLAISLGRQLEGGADSWRGAAGEGLAVTFWRGGGWGSWVFGIYSDLISMFQDIPQRAESFSLTPPVCLHVAALKTYQNSITNYAWGFFALLYSDAVTLFVQFHWFHHWLTYWLSYYFKPLNPKYAT